MTNELPGTNRDLLIQDEYADDEKLKVRQRIHKQYTVPHFDFVEWVLDRITWRGNERVLDLGGGSGTYFAPVKKRIPNGAHFALDLSYGMILRQRDQFSALGTRFANGDGQQLPFADGSFDVVLANHMLYHMPDIDRAVNEIARILRPQGVLLAATNSARNMPELRTLHRRALLILTDFKYKGQDIGVVADRFALENAAAILARHFFAVSRHDIPSALVFAEAAPVLEYLESTRAIREAHLPREVTWEKFTEVIHQQVAKLIDHTGRLVINKLNGAFVATNKGGFAREYVEMLELDKKRR